MKQGTILLVEDNEDDATLTILAFKRANLLNKVVVADDGAKAIDFLFGDKAFAGTGEAMPILMILDLNLPKVSGLNVLKRVRSEERTKYLPVVVLTTSIEEEDVISSYARGANAYMRKPVGFEQFLDAAAKLGMFWLLTNIQPPAH